MLVHLVLTNIIAPEITAQNAVDDAASETAFPKIRSEGADVPTELQQRLDRLVEQLEQKREQLHIPGMAIAVVKDDMDILPWFIHI